MLTISFLEKELHKIFVEIFDMRYLYHPFDSRNKNQLELYIT